jgi:glucose-fructose oxidoreductase
MAIINKKQLLVPGEEGKRDITILEAIYKSAKSGQRVKL